MAGAEGVIFAFLPSWETGNAIGLAQLGHGLAASGQDLMWIGLVADIPYQPVIRCVEDIMQGNGQFHYAQVGSKVTTGFGNTLNEKGA